MLCIMNEIRKTSARSRAHPITKKRWEEEEEEGRTTDYHLVLILVSDTTHNDERCSRRKKILPLDSTMTLTDQGGCDGPSERMWRQIRSESNQLGIIHHLLCSSLFAPPPPLPQPPLPRNRAEHAHSFRMND